MSSVYLKTYGCSANQAESEIMAGLLEKAGFNIVKNIDDSDVVIINSCYVKSPTEQKILYKIRRIQEDFPDKRLVVGGCIPAAAPYKIKKIAPNASMISTHQITKIANVVKKILENKITEELKDKEDIKLVLPKIRKNPIIDIVPIGSGCTGSCSFCATRFAKGFIKSYPKKKILEEIKIAVKDGCKEIWLTGQDMGAYGLENNKRKLPELLNEIVEIPGDFFVRSGMINPNHAIKILPELVSAYKNKKIYKFLHLPLQSGDNEVLNKMIRGYTVEDFIKIVNEFRKRFKTQIWTDVIVGFPGETEEQFKKTIKLIKDVKPDWVNVSRYGKRPGTTAAKLKQLSSKVLKERSKKASELVRKISLEQNKKWLNWKGKILISKKGKEEDQWLGRNFAYKPILVNSNEDLLGKILEIKIIDFSHSHLIAQ